MAQNEDHIRLLNVSMWNWLLSALSLALHECFNLQSRKTVKGSAKSCCCFQYIQMDLCFYLPWNNQGPPWNPQTRQDVFYYKDPPRIFSPWHNEPYLTFLSEMSSVNMQTFNPNLHSYYQYCVKVINSGVMITSHEPPLHSQPEK